MPSNHRSFDAHSKKGAHQLSLNTVSGLLAYFSPSLASLSMTYAARSISLLPGDTRYATGSVVRDGIWFHTSPSSALEPAPGPGEYSPSIISNGYERGRTAKPSSGTVGRQVH